MQNQKKVHQSHDEAAEEQRKQEELRLKKEEDTRRKREEYKETYERAERQRSQAEEAQRKLAKKKGSSMSNYYIVIGVVSALCIYVVIMMFMNQQAPLNKTPVIDDKRMDEHNQHTPWQQGANKFFEGATLADAKKIVNSSFANHPNLAKCNVDDSQTPPESFDARTQWPNCMLPVGNQQRTCGSSYAFALTSATAERLCINSKDGKLTPLSVQELLSCDMSNQGCKGGYLNTALDYMRSKGIADEQCFPYQADSDTVKCDRMCQNPTKERVENYCILFGEDDIKRDIMKSGPVVAASQVHVDFLTYKSGVYTKGDDVPRFSGFQAVKIIGWGVESENEANKGNKYWLVQNSWGEDWGEHGVARISMGQELMFDQYAYSIKVRSDKPREVKETKAQPNKVNVEDISVEGDLNLDEEEKEIEETEDEEKKK